MAGFFIALNSAIHPCILVRIIQINYFLIYINNSRPVSAETGNAHECTN